MFAFPDMALRLDFHESAILRQFSHLHDSIRHTFPHNARIRDFSPSGTGLFSRLSVSCAASWLCCIMAWSRWSGSSVG
jgi:hypothetical protein